jgi:hypothetical protein
MLDLQIAAGIGQPRSQPVKVTDRTRLEWVIARCPCLFRTRAQAFAECRRYSILRLAAAHRRHRWLQGAPGLLKHAIPRGSPGIALIGAAKTVAKQRDDITAYRLPTC